MEINLCRLLHCTYLGLSFIMAVRATVHVATCNISWLISAVSSVPLRACWVTLVLLAALWRLSCLLFSSITRSAFVVVSAAFNCWFLFVGPKRSLLSKVELPPGHWDSNNDLREMSTQDLLRSDGLACNTKAMADNGGRLIEKYSSKSWHLPWGVQGFFTETTNMEAAVSWCLRAIFCSLCCSVVYWSQHSQVRLKD